MYPDLSIIIPTFKRDESLKNLIIHLKRQIGINIEILVVDQNHDDFFNDEMMILLSTVKHIKLKEPNASRARNIGFNNSTASNILFLDDDLLPDPEFCLKGLDTFKKYPDIKCFVPLVYSTSGHKQALIDIGTKIKLYHPACKELISIRDAMSAAVFFRRESFRLTGGFDEFLFDFARTAEDQEFFIRIFQRGFTLWCNTDLSVFHDENIPGGCELRTVDYWKTREKCIKSWTFRYRIHNPYLKSLSIKDIYQLCRSTFINKEVLFSGVKKVFKQIKLLINSLSESKIYLLNKTNFYTQEKYSFLDYD